MWVINTYPQFSEEALIAAAEANTPLGCGCSCLNLLIGGVVMLLLIAATGMGGFWLLTAYLPSLLLGSTTSVSSESTTLSTDEHYNQATALLEQAEYAIKKGNTGVDLALGEEKLKSAQRHIEQLPTSYTVYSYSSSKRRRSRRVAGQYSSQTVYDDQYADIRSKAEQLETQLTEKKQSQSRSVTFIKAAKKFAFSAATASQHPPHPSDTWKQIERQWLEAIAQLQKIEVEEIGYSEAQKLLTTYKTNLKIVRNRLQVQNEAQATLTQVNAQIQKLINSPPSTVEQLQVEIKKIINQLKTVKPGTTSYADVQQLLSSANNKLKQIQAQ
ncbi:hypothetical protein WA1_14385 [Scytonema hofmannii PCC 7110]|uniref:Uncharacterized protein n=2 Tax=Scytonema hofmannii TaxID=34078 RepID=A0A139XF16_9CYAN|nr:hypothetical protein WA1_14385 [Scytonema hofmannii PCC 7110]